MTIFVTSDSHFYHTNVIKYSYRPFKDVDDMNQSLISNWNNVVNKNDIVYHLGDLFLTNYIPSIEKILNQLNGTIRLIKGNHDKWISKLNRIPSADKIEWVKDYYEEKFFFNSVAYYVVMMHYPLRTWARSHYGSISLHGHCHGSLDQENMSLRRMDVGVDSLHTYYSPLELQAVVQVLEKRPLTYHHENRDG